MPFVDPSHPLLKLVKQDRRYTIDAYMFLLEALTYAQETLGLGNETSEGEREFEGGSERGRGSRTRRRRSEKHLTGQQLCEAARLYALDQYGFLARKVLGTWGIESTRDFGEIVFNMIEIGQMRKTRKDRKEDFFDVYDFQTPSAIVSRLP
jgi:hypothetical protein